MMLILPLNTDDATLANAGGKGANLTTLMRAGLPVPDGFIVTTEAYRRFVHAHELQPFILQTLGESDPSEPETLNAASAAIRTQFGAGTVPDDLADVIRSAYADLGRPPVAVRSSATAEDLPDMSFAGQQDTFLNVVGDDALLEAVVRCWSSLWTARAIGYRSRNGISHDEVALAAVVQEMVPSEASGVLFTANPLTGRRSETVIDATLGLGEALVAGQVEPDHYVVRRNGHRPTIEKTLGAKAIAIHGEDGGGTVTREVNARDHQAISDEAIVELADLGWRVADLLGGPQDVEWAWAEGRLYLLQSRPITSLYPLPERLPREPLRVLISFGALQGVLDPITPLGQDVFQGFAARIVGLFGYDTERETQQLFFTAGERLFINVSGAIRHPVWRHVFRRFLSIAEPGIGATLDELWDDPALAPERGRPPITPTVLRRAVPVAGPLVRRLIRSLRAPETARAEVTRRGENVLAGLRARAAAATTLRDRIGLLETVHEVFVDLAPRFMARILAGMLSLMLLRRLVGERALVLTRGIPHNVTTQMDLALWEVARIVRSDPASAAWFADADGPALAEAYLDGTLPPASHAAIAAFLDRYGMRGVGEIDVGRPRWRDDPTPLMRTLRSYLNIDDPEQAPDAVFARGAAAAETGIDALVDDVHGARFGRIKALLVRWLARRVRALGGIRESPKFFLIRALGFLREELLTGGRDLVEADVLERPEDVFFLHVSELEAVAEGRTGGWKDVVARRRTRHEREKRRRQIPRVLLSDGRAFYEGLGAAESGEGNVITGSPVSPGIVEGRVHVVLDPDGTELAPGEILVCPATDPGWTPLFLAAGGLVMEIGGLMTHGSVVAREYGIPAVVGVHEATRRLTTGQHVRVDGSTGRIEVLEDVETQGWEAA